jgi:hypothetical protein
MPNAVSLSHLPMKSSHASPKFMAPRQSGETRTPAVGARTRWKSSRDLACGGGPKGDILMEACVGLKGIWMGGGDKIEMWIGLEKYGGCGNG